MHRMIPGDESVSVPSRSKSRCSLRGIITVIRASSCPCVARAPGRDACGAACGADGIFQYRSRGARHRRWPRILNDVLVDRLVRWPVFRVQPIARFAVPGSRAPGRRAEPRRRPPIFITARFRTGSTLLWNIFRHIEGCTAYYEPFNERRWFDAAHSRVARRPDTPSRSPTTGASTMD